MSLKNKLQLNSDKCKELRSSFFKNPDNIGPIIVSGKEVEVVNNAELLGLTITNQLTWNAQIEKIIKKANKRLHFLVQLRIRERLPPENLVLFYITCIRSVIDGHQFYHSLPQYLQWRNVHCP
jgi:hypothetical protein